MIKTDFELSTGTTIYYIQDNTIYKSFISDKIVHYRGQDRKNVKYMVNHNDFPNEDLKIYLSMKDLCEDLERNFIDETIPKI